MKTIYDCIRYAWKKYPSAESIKGTVGSMHNGVERFACVDVLKLTPDKPGKVIKYWNQNEIKLYEDIKNGKIYSKEKI